MRPVLGDGQTERPTVQIAQLLERLVRQPFNGSEQDGVVRCLDRPGRDMERPTAPEIEQIKQQISDGSYEISAEGSSR